MASHCTRLLQERYLHCNGLEVGPQWPDSSVANTIYGQGCISIAKADVPKGLRGAAWQVGGLGNNGAQVFSKGIFPLGGGMSLFLCVSRGWG